MRKRYFGRKLKRDIHERTALFKGLLSDLVMHERIQSTEEKIKSIKADADKLITKAKYEDRLHAYSLLQPLVSSEAVNKLINEIAPRFANRQGGYTRILRINRRFNDNAKMAMIEWTEAKNIEGTPMKQEKKTTKKETKELNATIATSTKKVTAKAKTTKATTEKKPAKKITKKEEVK